MYQFRSITVADGPAFAALQHRAGVVDGVEAFTEYKAVSIANGRGHTVVSGDPAERLDAAAHAAWHHGDGDAAPHWAIELVVDPEQRTGQLWAAALRAIAARIPTDEHHVVWSRSLEFEAVAAAMGYRPARRLATMEVPLPIDAEADLPDGVRLAGFVVGRDAAEWLSSNNAAFSGHPENGGVTLEEFETRMHLDWFRPEDLIVAWDGDTLVGSCWTKRHPGDVGEIYIIGVRPEHQGRGLGRALVVAGLNHLAEAAGARTGMLYVDHQSRGAMMLYESLGFRPVRVTTMYELVRR